MNINSLLNNTANAHANNAPKTSAEKTQQKATTLAADNIDKFDANSVNVNRNYQKALEHTEHLNIQGYKGMSTVQIKNAVVADFVNFSMRQQSGQSFWKDILGETFNPRPFALEAYKAAEATSEKHDDYWGVEAVAERIFTFAKSLAGDRDDLFDTMKNAFLKGFNLASKAANNKLPDISFKTKERVLELFDGWEKEIAAKKNPPATPVEE